MESSAPSSNRDDQDRSAPDSDLGTKPNLSDRELRAARLALLDEACEAYEKLISGTVVYFMAGGGMIKIGVSGDVRKRAISIQNSSPVPVDLICVQPGNRMIEGLTNRKFAHLRRHGEWFDDTPELRAHIEAIKNGERVALLPAPSVIQGQSTGDVG